MMMINIRVVGRQSFVSRVLNKKRYTWEEKIVQYDRQSSFQTVNSNKII